MSLFGSSPDEAAPISTSSKSRNTLFDDDDNTSAASKSKSSLFADDDAQGAWGMPTPKKAARGELVKNLLDGAEVPDSYVDVFDNLLESDGSSGKISPAGVAKTLSAGNLSADAQSRIMSLVTSGGQLADLSRNEFNVLLALIGLSQQNEDITLDSVDEHRRS